MEKGLIFNIQKFSIHDGPGIRTTVFFKGCPLKCKWCSNPESQLHKLQILYDFEKCAHCKKCLLNCPKQAITEKENHMIFNHDKCIGCLQCVMKETLKKFKKLWMSACKILIFMKNLMVV